MCAPCGNRIGRTQLFLKQSWEQKKLSLPILRQVGHCRLPASFLQSTPMHFLVAVVVITAAVRSQALNGSCSERFQRLTTATQPPSGIEEQEKGNGNSPFWRGLWNSRTLRGEFLSEFISPPKIAATASVNG